MNLNLLWFGIIFIDCPFNKFFIRDYSQSSLFHYCCVDSRTIIPVTACPATFSMLIMLLLLQSPLLLNFWNDFYFYFYFYFYHMLLIMLMLLTLLFLLLTLTSYLLMLFLILLLLLPLLALLSSITATFVCVIYMTSVISMTMLTRPGRRENYTTIVHLMHYSKQKNNLP